MTVKATLVLCAVALIQAGNSAIVGGFGAPYGFGAGLGCGLAGPGLAYDGFLGYDGIGYGYGCGGVASTGGGLPCASASPIPPVGVSVLSENVYEGPLAIGGNLPFLGSVAIEGLLPTAGAAAVSYGCGSPVGIAVEEGAIATGIAPHAPGPFGFAPYAAGPGPIAPYGLCGEAPFGYGYGAGRGYAL